MKLTNARLCLDCDEVHEENQCPMCASESFAVIKRWVTTPEKRARVAAPAAAPSETVATYRALLAANPADGQPITTKSLLRGGALGLAVLGAAGWILHRKNAEKSAEKNSAKTEPDSTPETPA
jgi:hypothetical protein